MFDLFAFFILAADRQVDDVSRRDPFLHPAVNRLELLSSRCQPGQEFPLHAVPVNRHTAPDVGRNEPTVEAVALVVLALVALGMLSMRFGHDSRGGPRSKEEQLAAYGMSWEDLRPRHLPATEPQAAPLPPLGEVLPRAA